MATLSTQLSLRQAFFPALGVAHLWRWLFPLIFGFKSCGANSRPRFSVNYAPILLAAVLRSFRRWEGCHSCFILLGWSGGFPWCPFFSRFVLFFGGLLIRCLDCSCGLLRLYRLATISKHWRTAAQLPCSHHRSGAATRQTVPWILAPLSGGNCWKRPFSPFFP